MKIGSFATAHTIEEALSLAKGHDNAAYIAGGTDILVKARESDAYANTFLIDISPLSELKAITETDDSVVIGSMATHGQIAASEIVKKYCSILADACATVGAPQIRNRATIGGNVANASPAADSLPALAALDAQVIVADAESGQRKTVPFGELITGSGKLSVSRTALIVSFIIPKRIGYAGMYYKLGRRNSLSISRMTIACILKKNEAGVVEDLNLAIGAVFPRPVVFKEINQKLIGIKPAEKDIEAFAKESSDKIPEIAGIRPTTKYKQPVCCSLIVRVLKALLEA